MSTCLFHAGCIERFLGGRERRAAWDERGFPGVCINIIDPEKQDVSTEYSIIIIIIIISCRSPSWQADFGPVCLCHALGRWSKKVSLKLLFDERVQLRLWEACGWWNKLAKIRLLGLKTTLWKGFEPLTCLWYMTNRVLSSKIIWTASTLSDFRAFCETSTMRPLASLIVGLLCVFASKVSTQTIGEMLHVVDYRTLKTCHSRSVSISLLLISLLWGLTALVLIASSRIVSRGKCVLAVSILQYRYLPNIAAILRIVEFVVTKTRISSAAATRIHWISPKIRERGWRYSWIKWLRKAHA